MRTLANDDLRSLTLFAIQRLTLWLFNVHHIFETDLTRPGTLPDRRRPLPPGVMIKIFRGEGEIGPLAEKLTKTGLKSATINDRMKAGDLVAVAFDQNGDIVGYTWETFSTVWIPEVRAGLVLGPGEIAGLDTFVQPQWRGKGLQYQINSWKFQYLSECGYERGLNWVNALNFRSIKSQSSQGKRKVATIFSLPMLNIVWLRKLPHVQVLVSRKVPHRTALCG